VKKTRGRKSRDTVPLTKLIFAQIVFMPYLKQNKLFDLLNISRKSGFRPDTGYKKGWVIQPASASFLIKGHCKESQIKQKGYRYWYFYQYSGSTVSTGYFAMRIFVFFA
jgi:hypothetical protein